MTVQAHPFSPFSPSAPIAVLNYSYHRGRDLPLNESTGASSLEPPLLNDRQSSIPPIGLAKLRTFLIAITLIGASAELAYAVVNVSAMPVFIPTIGLTSSQADYWIGIVGTAFLLTEGALKGPLGALSDRIGRKPLILLGPVISLFTALLTPFIHQPYALVVLRVLDGVGAAALWPAIFSLIADQVPQERRSTAMSLFNVAYIVGIALGPSLGGNANQFAQNVFHISESASKSASFYVAAVLFAITTLTAFLLLPGKAPVEITLPQNTPQNDKDDGKSEQKPGLLTILARMPLTLLLTFLIFLGIGFVMLYVKRFALEPEGPFKMSEQEFGNILILPALCIGALSVPMGNLGDRIGKPLAVKLGIGLCALSFCIALRLRPSLKTTFQYFFCLSS